MFSGAGIPAQASASAGTSRARPAEGYANAADNAATDEDPTGTVNEAAPDNGNPATCQTVESLCPQNQSLSSFISGIPGFVANVTGGVASTLANAIAPPVITPAGPASAPIHLWGNQNSGAYDLGQMLTAAGPVLAGNPEADAALFGTDAGTDAGLGVTTADAAPSITYQMQAHVDQAASDYDSGKIGMSAAQARAAAANPGLEAAYRGQVIDAAAKRAVSLDPALPSIYVTRSGEYGPDFLDLDSVPGTPQWWDMTTPGQWAQHVSDYNLLGTGTPLFTGPTP